MKKVKKHVVIEYSRGSNDGEAIYLNNVWEDGGGTGHRIAGSKCWGWIKPVKSFKLNISDLEELQKAAQEAIDFLKDPTRGIVEDQP